MQSALVTVKDEATAPMPIDFESRIVSSQMGPSMSLGFAMMPKASPAEPPPEMTTTAAVSVPKLPSPTAKAVPNATNQHVMQTDSKYSIPPPAVPKRGGEATELRRHIQEALQRAKAQPAAPPPAKAPATPMTLPLDRPVATVNAIEMSQVDAARKLCESRRWPGAFFYWNTITNEKDMHSPLAVTGYRRRMLQPAQEYRAQPIGGGAVPGFMQWPQVLRNTNPLDPREFSTPKARMTPRAM